MIGAIEEMLRKEEFLKSDADEQSLQHIGEIVK